MKKIAVIGGGAAGLAAAVSAASNGASVIIYEKNDRVGKKILATGNGRCNLTNKFVSPKCYNKPDFVKNTLDKYGYKQICDFFDSIGLLTYHDSEGRQYPVSDTATSVLDTLRMYCEKLNIIEKCSSEITDISKDKDKFKICQSNGQIEKFDRCIVTTGGRTSLLKSVGHKYVPFRPVLCPLKTDITPIKGLNGVRAKCSVSLSDGERTVIHERGEVLFRDYGVSGVVIFDISRYAKEGQILSIDFLPDIGKDELKREINYRKETLLRHGEDILIGIFQKMLCNRIYKVAGNDSTGNIVNAIKNFKIKILGAGDEKQAQVTAGGVDVTQFNSETMESKLLKGIFAAGEALDIDGRCGGFNLHWAFSSGLVAGYNAAMEEY